jgi:transcription antitermination factor NusG
MHSTGEKLGWYAVQVASRKEKQTASILSEKGYECFIPLYSKRSVWSDRNKVTSVPLFSGYVFTRFDVRTRLPILVTPNVRAIVGYGNVPAAVPEEDLEAIRTALQNGLSLEPYDCLHEGEVVRVTKGPLAGIEGHFTRYRGTCRLILSVELINRSVAVELDRMCVEPVSQQGHRRTRLGRN